MLNPTLTPAQKRIYMLMNKFRELRDSNILDDNGYFKELVILAYELGKEGFVDDAITMLLRIDVEYFGRRQLKQAEDDPIYKAILENLQLMIEDHYDTSVNTLMPTQGPAQA